MVGRTLAKWEVSLWFCSDYGWQNVGKVRSFALILLGLWLAERWQSEKSFALILLGFWQNVGKVRSFALILFGLWLAERWQSEKFRFDFARIMVGRTLAKWKKFRFDFARIMVGRTLAKLEISLWFCSDYGWQNVGKVRSFALILLGLWLAERWQSEKFRFDFAGIMVGKTLAKWKKFRFDFTRILAQRWQSEKFRFDFVRIMVGRTLAKWKKFRFDFARIMVGRTLAKLEISLWLCSEHGW